MQNPFLSPVFPEPLESFLLAAAKRETRAASDRDAARRLAPHVARMGDRFTVARGAAEGDYLPTARAALAYALYFAPAAHAHLVQILSELPVPSPPRGGVFRILDLGAGTGSAGFAAAAWAAAAGAKVRLAAFDRSRAALRLLRESFAAVRPIAFPGAEVETAAGDLLADGGGEPVHSLAIAHFVANELPRAARGAFWARAAASLAPGGLLVACEPYLHDDPGWMRETRDALLAAGLVLRAPCPHAGPCPLAGPCHAVRRLVPPRARQMLCSALGRPAAAETAYSFLVAERPRRGADAEAAAEGAPPPARIVGSPVFAKGQTLLPLCLPDGTAEKMQILHRGLPAAQVKALRRKERGEALALAGTERVGETLRGTLRAGEPPGGAPR